MVSLILFHANLLSSPNRWQLTLYNRHGFQQFRTTTYMMSFLNVCCRNWLAILHLNLTTLSFTASCAMMGVLSWVIISPFNSRLFPRFMTSLKVAILVSGHLHEHQSLVKMATDEANGS